MPGSVLGTETWGRIEWQTGQTPAVVEFASRRGTRGNEHGYKERQQILSDSYKWCKEAKCGYGTELYGPGDRGQQL